MCIYVDSAWSCSVIPPLSSFFYFPFFYLHSDDGPLVHGGDTIQTDIDIFLLILSSYIQPRGFFSGSTNKLMIMTTISIAYASSPVYVYGGHRTASRAHRHDHRPGLPGSRRPTRDVKSYHSSLKVQSNITRVTRFCAFFISTCIKYKQRFYSQVLILGGIKERQCRCHLRLGELDLFRFSFRLLCGLRLRCEGSGICPSPAQ